MACSVWRADGSVGASLIQCGAVQIQCFGLRRDKVTVKALGKYAASGVYYA